MICLHSVKVECLHNNTDGFVLHMVCKANLYRLCQGSGAAGPPFYVAHHAKHTGPNVGLVGRLAHGILLWLLCMIYAPVAPPHCIVCKKIPHSFCCAVLNFLFNFSSGRPPSGDK